MNQNKGLFNTYPLISKMCFKPFVINLKPYSIGTIKVFLSFFHNAWLELILLEYYLRLLLSLLGQLFLMTNWLFIIMVKKTFHFRKMTLFMTFKHDSSIFSLTFKDYRVSWLLLFKISLIWSWRSVKPMLANCLNSWTSYLYHLISS